MVPVATGTRLACSVTMLAGLLMLVTGPWIYGQQPSVLAIVHAGLIDGTGAPLREDMTVIVSGGRIARIGRSQETAVDPDATIVEARGRFVIPGLWDMHQHLGSFAEGTVRASTLLAAGITGIRDMGSPLDDILRLRKEAVARGQCLYVSGPLLQGPLPFQMPMFVSVRSPAEARAVVGELRRDGVDFIKIQDAIPRDIYFAVAAEVRRQHLSLAGHIPPTVTAMDVVDAGQRSVEHLGGRFFGVLAEASTQARAIHVQEVELYRSSLRALERHQDPPDDNMKAPFTTRLVETYDAARAARLFSAFRRNNTWQCPTLVTIQGLWDGYTDADKRAGERLFEKSLDVVRNLHRAGVPLLAGTDIAPGRVALHDELALLVRAGLTPMEALQTATRNAALFTDTLKDRGTIEPGKIADIVLLKANPLLRIQNTREIEMVIAGGTPRR
jgi:cytosine/adenosine deaminase-related metal-dependent hydrolase